MAKSLKTLSRWLTPGMGLKRWVILLFVGIIFLALGGALYLRNLYGLSGYPIWIRMLALQALPRWVRAVIFGGIGVGIIGLALYRLNETIWLAFLPGEPDAAAMAEQLHRARQRRKGPKIVTVGGGTGMSTLLRGLKAHTDNITAIVTVADDGGSSGRLRDSLGVLPPGDIRNCIAALADDDALTTQLFQYRFAKPENREANAGVAGHSFGNLFITALAGVTGSFERAVAESGRVLAIRGQIVPSTLENVTLFAEVTGEAGAERVRGESNIPHTPYPIERVYLQPENPPAFPGAIRAILDADLIVLGPGSLFTSLLPNLLIPDIARAIRASDAPKIYICNVATQLGETDGFSLVDHISALENHVGAGFFTHVLVNDNLTHSLPSNWTIDLVNPQNTDKIVYGLVPADVVDVERPWRHDPHKLAQALITWFQTEMQRGA